MSTGVALAHRSRFTGRIAPAGTRKSPENKPFHGHRSTLVGKAHCIKDSVLLDETCGSSGFMAWAKNNSEVIWSEQRSI
jgi:hypothetical protein